METVPTGDYYVVQSGDTLYSIAKNNGLTIDKLKSLNNLTSKSQFKYFLSEFIFLNNSI
jgi:LysM repeat protein